MVKISLRMKLSDFLNKSHEKGVMNKLFEIHNDKIITKTLCYATQNYIIDGEEVQYVGIPPTHNKKLGISILKVR